jgi:hypothetical protein
VTVSDLNEAERQVWEASARGTWVDFRTGDPGADDPAKADGWGPERTVRAEVITALLLGAGAAEPGRQPAVRLRGARVTGRLDLIGADVDRALICEDCRFDEPLRCLEATIKTVRLVACRFPSFNGARMRTEGVVNFRACVVDEGVRLDLARVGGEVSFRGANLGTNGIGVALSADGMTVDGPVECNAGFTAAGTVLLRGLRAEGTVDFSDATVIQPGGNAIYADRAVINGQFRANRLIAEGQVRLRNASIAGDMGLSGSRLSDPGGTALSCGGLVIHGGVWCRDGFTAEGELRFIGAELRATLNLEGAKLSNPGGLVLNLDRAGVGDLSAVGIAVSGGQISLVGSQVTDQVTFERGRLACTGGDDEIALRIEGTSIGGALWLRYLDSVGEVQIRNSSVRGRVTLRGARVKSIDKVALRFTRNEVGTGVVCDGLVAVGETRFVGSHIGRHLDMNEVSLVNPGGVALDAHMLRAREVTLLPGQPIEGSVILEHATIELLHDDPATWPADLRLDGLTYEALQPLLPATRRLQWLARNQNGFQPQPYEQLAAHYTRTGQSTESRRVLHAKERCQRATKPFLGRLWSVLQDATVAYGYQPWRPVLWLALLLIVGGVTYGITEPPPLRADEAPHFNAVIYTLDLLLPIVDLGQERAFNPAGAQQWFSYFLIAAGWILATTIAAGVARIISRR